MIAFMVESINRWLKHPDQKIRQHIIDYFDTEECLDIANKYKRIQELRELYQAQLRGVARYVRYFEMRNYKNRPIYYLFFATNSKLGFVKMKEAMWTIDPSGEFRFSDATNSKQLVLFEIDPIPELNSLAVLCTPYNMEPSIPLPTTAMSQPPNAATASMDSSYPG